MCTGLKPRAEILSLPTDAGQKFPGAGWETGTLHVRPPYIAVGSGNGRLSSIIVTGF